MRLPFPSPSLPFLSPGLAPRPRARDDLWSGEGRTPAPLPAAGPPRGARHGGPVAPASRPGLPRPPNPRTLPLSSAPLRSPPSRSGRSPSPLRSLVRSARSAPHPSPLLPSASAPVPSSSLLPPLPPLRALPAAPSAPLRAWVGLGPRRQGGCCHRAPGLLRAPPAPPYPGGRGPPWGTPLRLKGPVGPEGAPPRGPVARPSRSSPS